MKKKLLKIIKNKIHIVVYTKLYQQIDKHKNIIFDKSLYDGYIRIGFKRYYYKFDLMEKPFIFMDEESYNYMEEPRYVLYINGIMCKVYIPKYSEFQLKELLKQPIFDYELIKDLKTKEKEVKKEK